MAWLTWNGQSYGYVKRNLKHCWSRLPSSRVSWSVTARRAVAQRSRTKVSLHSFPLVLFFAIGNKGLQYPPLLQDARAWLPWKNILSGRPKLPDRWLLPTGYVLSVQLTSMENFTLLSVASVLLLLDHVQSNVGRGQLPSKNLSCLHWNSNMWHGNRTLSGLNICICCFSWDMCREERRLNTKHTRQWC